MVTAEVVFALIGSLLFKSAIPASINYEPIKITVNENFNTKPGQVSIELQALEPSVLHQGANFYFKPQLNLPQSFIPSHIEALISLIQQHHHSCPKDASKVVVDKDKLIEILQPFIYPLSENSKERLLESDLEKENTLKIVKTPQIIEKMVTEPLPVIITEEPKHVTPELLAPVLPQFSFDDFPAFIEKQVKKEESVILEEPEGEYLTIPEIAVRPITEPIINYVEPKLMTAELVNIPDAPVLPPFSFNGIPPNVEEEIRKEETAIVEGKGVFPAIPEIALRPIQESIINYVEPEPTFTEFQVIPEAPVLPPHIANNIKLIEYGVKIKESVVIDVESKPEIQEYVVIPEAPVLPPLAFHDIPSIVEKEEKKEEPIIFEDAARVFSTIPEIVVRPIQEPIINYVEPEPTTSDLSVIPEAPVLPTLSANDIHVLEEVEIEEPIVVDVEPNPIIQELVIPEAPILPPLSLKSIPSIFKEKLKEEDSIIFDEQTSVVPIIPEMVEKPIEEPLMNYVEPKPIITEFQVIPEAPALPPLSANEIKVIEDGVKFNEPIVVDVKKPAIQEYVVIPEAPVLPPLALHDIPSIVKKEEKKEEPIIFEDAARVFSTIPEIVVRPIQEPIINYVEPEPTTSDLSVIPEAPVLPTLSANDIHVLEEVEIEEPIVVDVEPNPIIQELVIPEAPILPPLSLESIPSIFKEKLKKEESIIFDEQTIVVPTIPEMVEKPIEEPLMNYVEPKPIITEFQVIPEAPALPPLSANEIKVIEDGVKFNEPIVVDVKKPAIQEYVVIPEAPVLPPLAHHNIPSIVEIEVKKEESVIFKDATRVFSTIPEIAVRPIQELIINYVEPEPTTSDLLVLPEAPVLPTLSANDIHVLEEVEIEEPIGVDVEPNPIIEELVLPEAPILPPLSLKNIPSFFEEKLKNQESIIFEEPAGVLPTIPEIVVRPIEEPTVNYGKQEPTTADVLVIPGAPVLSTLSANDIHVLEEVKIEEPIVVDVKSNPVIQELVLPEAPILPPLSLKNIPSIFEEKLKNEISIIFEEPVGVLSTIPEIVVRPIEEPTINYVKQEPTTADVLVIPDAPVLPPLSPNDIHVVEEVKFEEPIVFGVEPATATQELVIPEAPILPPLTLKSIASIFEEKLKKEESIIFDEQTSLVPTIPEMVEKPIEEPLMNYVEAKPIITEFQVIPEAPALPPLSFIPSVTEEEMKKEESSIFDAETGELPSIPEISLSSIPEPSRFVVSETAESFALENNVFPVAEEEVKIEIPILLEETIDIFPPIAEISSGESIQDPEITNSYVLEEVSQSNAQRVVTVKETLPPTIIPKPSNNLGVFSYAPFVSHLSNRAPKTNKLSIAKPASLERFLLKRHPFRLPVTPFPKLSPNKMEAPIWENKKQFLYPTSYAHDVVEKRIAPNMAFKKNAPPKRVKIYIRSQVSKEPSYL